MWLLGLVGLDWLGLVGWEDEGCMDGLPVGSFGQWRLRTVIAFSWVGIWRGRGWVGGSVGVAGGHDGRWVWGFGWQFWVGLAVEDVGVERV